MSAVHPSSFIVLAAVLLAPAAAAQDAAAPPAGSSEEVRRLETEIEALKRDTRVRWSETHEPASTDPDAPPSLRRLIVDFVLTGNLYELAGGHRCELRILDAKEQSPVRTAIVDVGAGAEREAAEALERQAVAAILAPPS